MAEYITNYIENTNRIIQIESINQSSFLNIKRIQANTYQDAFVLPRKKIAKYPYAGLGGVVDKDRRFVEASADFDTPHKYETLSLYPLSKYKFGGMYTFDKYEICHENIIFGGMFHKHWGHFITDVIQRLWYVLSTFDYDYKIVYVTYENDDSDSWDKQFVEFFELCGIDKQRIKIISAITQFDKVIVPEAAFLPGKWYTKEYRSVIEFINNKIKNHDYFNNKAKEHGSRILLSTLQREEIKKNIGIDKLCRVFEKYGFEVVYPEKLSLIEQLTIYYHADYLASTSGSMAHNFIFTSDNCKPIYLCSRSYPYWYQITLDAMTNKKITWIDIYNQSEERISRDAELNKLANDLVPTKMLIRYLDKTFSNV